MFGDRCSRTCGRVLRRDQQPDSRPDARPRPRTALALDPGELRIPGLAPPVALEGELLADGGILDNLPVDATRDRCSGRIVASDVSVPIDLRPAPSAEARRCSPGGRSWERLNPVGTDLPSFPGIVDILQRTALLGSVRDSPRRDGPLISTCDRRSMNSA